MSRIQIDISKVRSCNEELRRNNLKISNIARNIFLSMGSIDSRIQARRNIGSRLKNACDECNEIEQKLTKLQKFISNSMDTYEKAERKVENESEELIALWNLRMETLVELKSMVEILGTSSSYIENAKMLYDGEKVGDDEDEDAEKILEETDELLKEVNEEDDNDWRNKPAKKDIFDKFADWLTEKVTGEKASPKTQGEEVIEAQLTTMSFDEQSILADITSDYQTAFRGLASADRINEALENFEEEPVFSSGNSNKGESNLSFASEEKLDGHFEKHGREFKGEYSNATEYLEGAREVINNGYKVQYKYKVKVKGSDGKIIATEELRTGYIRFMGTNSKGVAKFEFVGTNLNGDITTYHTESGKTLWKLLNGSTTDKTINPVH